MHTVTVKYVKYRPVSLEKVKILNENIKTTSPLANAKTKSSLQNLNQLPTSVKVEPLAKPKTGLKFFVNTTKPKTKVFAVFWQKLETKVSTVSLNPG